MSFVFPKCRLTFAGKALMIFVSLLPSLANAADRLYLLAGTSASSRVDLPVRLYRVSTGGTVELVKDVARGMSAVLADYEGRRLVVASPALKTNEFSFVSMDNPALIVEKQVPPFASQTLPGQIYLLNLPDKGPGVALALNKVTDSGQVTYPSVLTFVGLNSTGEAASIPFDDLKYLRVSGNVGGALEMYEARVSVNGDPLRVVGGRAAGAGTGDPIMGMLVPSYLRGREPLGFELVVNDSERAVMVPLDPGVVDVLNKMSGEWRRVPIPFSSPVIRGFGPWLAMIDVRSSGARSPAGSTIVAGSEPRIAKLSPRWEKRRSETIGPSYKLEPGLTVDDLFWSLDMRGVFFPGELFIYNLDTGAQMKISTGSGDSEVVFVDDDAVYYRVDDILYRQQISGSARGGPVKVAQGEEIVQVHWAFLSAK